MRHQCLHVLFRSLLGLDNGSDTANHLSARGQVSYIAGGRVFKLPHLILYQPGFHSLSNRP